jgi:hypothetical protein
MALTPPPVVIISVYSCCLAILYSQISAIHFLFFPMFFPLTKLTSWDIPL